MFAQCCFLNVINLPVTQLTLTYYIYNSIHIEIVFHIEMVFSDLMTSLSRYYNHSLDVMIYVYIMYNHTSYEYINAFHVCMNVYAMYVFLCLYVCRFCVPFELDLDYQWSCFKVLSLNMCCNLFVRFNDADGRMVLYFGSCSLLVSRWSLIVSNW